jgi:hypothetical protein
MTDELESPVVQRVREVRRKIAQDFACDLGKYVEFLKQQERASDRAKGSPRKGQSVRG